MPGPPPLMVVRFYENFTEVEVDVHFVGGSTDNGHEMRTYAVHEVIEENIGPDPEEIPPEHDRFEVVEEKDYTEERNASYVSAIFHVEASSGTWKIEFIKFESGEAPIFSSPISHLFDAAAVRAAISEEDIGNDPSNFHIFRRSLRTEFGDIPGEEEPGDPTVAAFINRPDLGPNSVQMKIFFGSGLLSPRVGAGINRLDIDLGPIWELRKEWDEVVYGVVLEENPACSGKGVPIVVPEGVIHPNGPRNARVVSRSKITGRVASVAAPPSG